MREASQEDVLRALIEDRRIGDFMVMRGDAW